MRTKIPRNTSAIPAETAVGVIDEMSCSIYVIPGSRVPHLAIVKTMRSRSNKHEPSSAAQAHAVKPTCIFRAAEARTKGEPLASTGSFGMDLSHLRHTTEIEGRVFSAFFGVTLHPGLASLSLASVSVAGG